MKFQITRRVESDEVEFRGSFRMRELEDLDFNRLEKALLNETPGAESSASDSLLALELIYRRYEEHCKKQAAPRMPATEGEGS